MRSHLEVAVGVHATFIDAGHILGSASIFLEFEEQSHGTSVLFSGDLGNAGRLLLRSPNAAATCRKRRDGNHIRRPIAQAIVPIYR